MWPLIGNLRTYTFVYVASMLIFLVVGLRLCRRMQLPRKAAIGLGFCYFFGMAVGARILYDLLHHRFSFGNYLNIRYYFADGMWGGPLAYLATATIAILVLGGKRRRDLLDLMALSLPIPMILAKAACFGNGCCGGEVSNMPWAMSFPVGSKAPDGLPRHPTQLYEIIVLLVILAVFQVLDKQRWRGTFTAWFVLFYGVGRPLTELFRAPDDRVVWYGPLSSSQLVCVTASLVAAIVLLFAKHSMPRDQLPVPA